jgi:lipopolysaccharide/colanic/teichoic acid biosynthesis glycosyltransferase
MQLDEMIVAQQLNAERRLKAIFAKSGRPPLDLRGSAKPLAEAFPARGASRVGGVPILEIADRPLTHRIGVAKWAEDMIVGTLLLVLLPAMSAAALLIKLNSREPVFRRQRLGFNNFVIRVVKFCTMHVDRGDPSGAAHAVRDDLRVTRIGRPLRGPSLDELLQVINVVRGEMSLVAPRPHAITTRVGHRLSYDAVEDYHYRHRVKPNINGWAQINGLRGEIDTLKRRASARSTTWTTSSARREGSISRICS